MRSLHARSELAHGSISNALFLTAIHYDEVTSLQLRIASQKCFICIVFVFFYSCAVCRLIVVIEQIMKTIGC